MARFEQMEQEMAAARQDISQLSEAKAQVEEMFRQGYLFRQEDGGIAIAESEQVRQQVAESARKP